MSTQAQKTYYSQHPVPQHVLGVEFKLVGGLTIRQFAYLGGSIVLAYLIYASILPFIFRIPIALVVLILGASITFIPVNERPMDDYLRNFLIAISSPTERYWIKEIANIDILYESVSLAQAPATTTETPQRNTKNIKDYIAKMKPEGARSTLELKEEEYLKSIASEFASSEAVATTTVIQEQPVIQKPPEAFRPERVEVSATPTLASEVNFSNENVLSIPALGKTTKRFITPIKNIRAGRKLHSFPTVAGEIVMPVAGEIILKAAGDDSADSQEPTDLVKKAQETVSNLDRKITDMKSPEQANTQLKAQPANVPFNPKPAPVFNPKAEEPEVPVEPKPVTPKDQIKNFSAPTQPIIPQERPYPQPTQPVNDGKVAGQVVALNEELERIRKQNEQLLMEVEKQKKARNEAEVVAEETQKYQGKLKEAQEQNEKLNQEIRRINEEFRKTQDKVSITEAEKENVARNLKEQQRRLEALARDKAESVDEIVRLQKEIQEARNRSQKTSTENFMASKSIPTPQPADALKNRPKPPAFIKDLPNVINGYVKDKAGSLVKNAVIIVKDQNDDVVRALKTNELGQFAITTPLPNGLYRVEASAADNNFDIITVDLVGTVLDPIEFYGR